uniref:Uncharacterized protein MANES_01G032100 n=1 Tax=Rhizophora mucronata TaxID=61149 RepID=A0A2P2JFC3_RHIMU
MFSNVPIFSIVFLNTLPGSLDLPGG